MECGLEADLLAQAIETVGPHLDAAFSIHHRIRRLWAGIVAARELAAADVIEAEFMRLAEETGLARDLGRHADEDLRHVIRWGMLNRNPFDCRDRGSKPQ
jgi:hypothetical protein